MTVVVLSRDLLIASRVVSVAEAENVAARTVAQPADLPPADEVDVLFVNWTERDADWGRLLNAWCAGTPEESARPRIVLFGPHTDLEAHAAAREAGLGPMMARSKLVADLPRLLSHAPGAAVNRHTGASSQR